MVHARQKRPDFGLALTLIDLNLFSWSLAALKRSITIFASVENAFAGSYLRLRDLCITQLKAQGPSMTCNDSQAEEEGAFDDSVLRAGGVLF